MLGLLYDVHGNLPALEAVLGDAREVGVGRWIVGGDVALFGAWPAETLARLRELAHVRARSAGTQDVTGSFDALVARLSDARAVHRATLHALRRTSDPALVASLRRRLDALRARIAREQRALDALRRSTGLARVEVDLDTTRAGTIAPPSGGAWTPRDALRDAARVLEVAAGVILVALAALAPVALLAALGAAAGRVLRRRRRDAALG